MKLGFIGTGTIATSVIEGLLKSKAKIGQINISTRSYKNSIKLRKKSKKIRAYSENQDIINNSSIVFIGLLPKVASKELKICQFKKSQTIVSFVSTLNIKSLKKLCNPVEKIVKAAPLPMASDGLSPTIIYPNHKLIKSLFELTGSVIVAKNENQNNHLWVMSSFMATYLNIFLTGMLFEFNHQNFDLNKSIKSLQTRGGINEELLKRLQKDKFFKKIDINLKKIFLRLKKANDK
jgi:pyrroline-5-carboxylate reductase